MLKIVASTQFRKDLKLAAKRGYKLDRLRVVVDALANQQPLDEKYRDHSLSGSYSSFRECHVEPDWLLIYRANDVELELYLFRTGTHADLFSK